MWRLPAAAAYTETPSTRPGSSSLSRASNDLIELGPAAGAKGLTDEGEREPTAVRSELMRLASRIEAVVVTAVASGGWTFSRRRCSAEYNQKPRMHQGLRHRAPDCAWVV